MSDRFTTVIEMGGDIRPKQLLMIAQLAGQCGFSCDYEQNDDAAWIHARLLDQLKHDDQYLVVCDNDIAHEMWTDLTDYLRQQKIPFNIRVEAKFEFDADLHWWRPGMKRVETWSMMDHEATTVMCSLPMLEKALKRRTKLETVVKRLRKIAPPMPEVYLVEPRKKTTTGSGKGVDQTQVKH